MHAMTNQQAAPEQVKNLSSAEGSQLGSEDDILHLVAHPDENVNMAQCGHLQHWFSSRTHEVFLHAPAVTSPPVMSQMVSSLFLFPNLHILNLSIAHPSFQLRQSVFCAIAELGQLTQVSLTGGSLKPGSEGPKLEVLSSLRRLEHLALCPHKPDGLGDEHLSGLALLSASSLKSLTFRGSTENLSDEGLQHLEALHGLTSLHILPLGLGVTREGTTRLCAALPKLHVLAAGLQQVGQVSAVREQGGVQALSIIANDPDASASEWASLVTHCTLCLSLRLVTLRLGLLKMPDCSFMLALDTLGQLTELKFAVGPASLSTPAFTCDIATLSSLSKLQTLDIACTSRLRMPFTPRTVSVCALAWPHLTALSLSVMGRDDLVPESLALLDVFSRLRSLSLCCSLDYSEGSGSKVPHAPVDLKYLPTGLVKLQLEHAELAAATTAQAAAHSCSLSSLQLDDCLASDAWLLKLLEGMPGLLQLELNCVEGLTPHGLYDSLQQLTRLERLVVCGLGKPPAKQRWSLEQAAVSLATSAPTLMHLEWAPGTADRTYKLPQLGMALEQFNSLQFLYIDALDEGLDDTDSGWQAELQRKLPLCTVTTDMAATLMTYDIQLDMLAIGNE